MTKVEQEQVRAVLAKYYTESVGQSVLQAPPGVVQAGTPAPPQPPNREKAAQIRTLEDEATALRVVIDAAYWRFTRQARALPPSMQCPEAYARLREINEKLITLKE